MFKRLAVALTAFLVFFGSYAEAAKPDKWLIYWYVCGTDIESTRIAFGTDTELMSGKITLAEPDREPGDATRCINEVEKATLSPNVRIFMQAGGTYIWGHEKFRDLNAKIETKVTAYDKIKDENGKEQFVPVTDTVLFGNKVSVYQWFLKIANGHTVAQPVQGGNGKLGRYVYDKNHRNWYAREQLPISGNKDTETDMGSKAGFVSFLKAGQKLEQELYPDGNVRRVLIFVDHGGGIRGVCVDDYTKNMLSLNEIKESFSEVQYGWNNSEGKPFEVVAFDACIMSVYESAIALKDSANYMVASQESTIGKVMFGYTDLLNKLSKNPSMSGKELGKVICNATWEDSKITDKEFGINSNIVFTESVIDLSEQKMAALKTAYTNFNEETVKVAQKNPEDIVYTFTKFKNAANVSDRFSIIAGKTPDMVDLKNFAGNVGDTFPELKTVSNKLVKAVDNSVVYNKRGNVFKRGGGLSIYCPFGFIHSGGDRTEYQLRVLNYKNITQGLNSESFGKLYDYLFEGVDKNLQKVVPIDSETREPIINPLTNRPYNIWQIPEDSILNISELSAIPVEVDEDKKTATIELDEDQQKGVESVRYRLIYVVPRNDGSEKMDMLFLGSDSDIKENRQTGTFELNFNKKWLCLDNNPLYFQVVSDATRKNKNGKKISGNDICMAPILLNGQPYKLFFSRSYPNEKVTVIGLVKNEDREIFLKSGNIPFERQLPNGDLKGLKKGDIVTPLYFYVKEDEIDDSKPFENMTNEEKIALVEKITARGKSITIGDKPKFEMANLYNGIFAYVFEFVNSIGDASNNVITKEGAVCKVKNGKIVKVIHSEYFDDISDLED